MSSKTTSAEPQLLPSPPPSPTPSDTPTVRGPAHISEADLTPETSTTNKGKGRLEWSSIDSQQSDLEDGDDEYPVDEAETKRIEETLRKWETEERERRRVARESAPSFRNSVLDATRSAGSIFAGLGIHRPLSGTGGGGGHHHALPDNEQEDGVPLEDLDRTPPPSGANTPTLKQRFDTYHPNSDPATTNNPFENPDNVLNASTTSLNTPDHPTILTESSEPPPILSTAAKQKRQRGAPPPLPLGLPKPRTPPPRNDEGQVYITEPPEHTAGPSTASGGADHPNMDETEKEKKWWTEWLCGCSEGPERGGYTQSGRTNPNE